MNTEPTIFELNDNLDFDFENLPASYYTQRAEKNQKARAAKTRSRIHARRAKAEATLDEILPKTIQLGDSWHVLSSGDIDSLSYLNHIVKNHTLDYCLFSTWCMAMPDIAQFKQWLETGRIKHLDAYVGEIFPGQYADEYAALVEITRQHGGRTAVFKNHSKVFICKAPGLDITIESSANINTNPRTENTVITHDAGLTNHHKEYFDGIKSFNKEFPTWAPQQ